MSLLPVSLCVAVVVEPHFPNNPLLPSALLEGYPAVRTWSEVSAVMWKHIAEAEDKTETGLIPESRLPRGTWPLTRARWNALI
jgi:hypothetical protein